MNIFKILSAGDSSLKEPALTAILGYYLTPSETHGMKSILLEYLIKPFVLSDENDMFQDLKLNNEDKVLNLSNISNYSISIAFEERLDVVDSDSKQSTRELDLLIEIKDEESKNIKYVFGIENKINKAAGSSDDYQLTDEVFGLVKKYVAENSDVKIGFIFLTKDAGDNNDKYEILQEYVNENYYNCLSLKKFSWKRADNTYNTSSISELIENILLQDTKGRIEPLHSISQYLLKSLIGFIDTDFRSSLQERSEMENIMDNQREEISIDAFNEINFQNNDDRKKEFLKILTYCNKIYGTELKLTKTRFTVNLNDKTVLRVIANKPKVGWIQIHFTDTNGYYADLDESEIKEKVFKNENIAMGYHSKKDNAFFFEFESFDEISDYLNNIVKLAKDVLETP